MIELMREHPWMTFFIILATLPANESTHVVFRSSLVKC